jgi:hypothetical protein
MKPIDINEKRLARLPSCEWCGEPAHLAHGVAMPLLCPRVRSVSYSAEEVRVYFDAAPVVIAMRDLPRFADVADE